MRFLRQSLVGLLLAFMTLALLVYAGQIIRGAVQLRLSNERPAPVARERVFAVNAITAELQAITPVLQAFGQVQSRRTLEIRAPAGGRIITLTDSFEEGGIVRAGEVLAQIDPADARAAFQRAESDVSDARAEGRDGARGLVLAKDELAAAREQADLRTRAQQRQKDLRSRGVGTAAAVETAELAAAAARQAVLSRRQAVASAEGRVDMAATRLARAEIALEAARRDLDELTVRAGFGGVLSEVSLVEGRLVSANEKLAELIDPTALEVSFRVSTAQYARLLGRSGSLVQAPITAILNVTGADLTASGSISRDSAATGEGQSGRVIFARLDGSDGARGFEPGDFVTVTVEEPELTEVVRLPASALDAGSTVLVLDEDSRLESLKVELVRRQGDDVLVRGVGLEGRRVVAGRTPLLGVGIRVRALGEEAEEPELLELTDARRARLVAFVQSSNRMPEEVKADMLEQLTEAMVPARLVQRIEARMGG